MGGPRQKGCARKGRGEGETSDPECAPNVVGAFVWGITRNHLTNKRRCFIIKVDTGVKVTTAFAPACLPLRVAVFTDSRTDGTL